MKDSIRKQINWCGTYRGVNYLINNWSWNEWESCHWAFYLFLHVDRLPESINPKKLWLDPVEIHNGRARYDYNRPHILNEIDWHCGLTYYEKVHGFDGESQTIKVGCDYGHAYDQGIEYDEKDLLRDIKLAIDSFWELVPDYKCFCRGNGNLYLAKDGKFAEPEGEFYSNEYLSKKVKLKGK